MRKTLPPHRRMFLIVLLLGCLLFNYGFSTSFAAKIDLYDVISETQQTYEENGRHILVWWLAEPYWKALVSRSNLKPGDAELVLASLKPYIMIAVSNFVRSGPQEPQTFVPFETLREIVKVEVEGVTYSPLRRKELNSIALKLVQEAEPDLPKMLDPKWKEVSIFTFKVEKNGDPLISPSKPGIMTVNLNKRNFVWRTPLSTAVPPQYCPACGVSLNGGYNYCPWDGNPLRTSEPPKAPKSK